MGRSNLRKKYVYCMHLDTSGVFVAMRIHLIFKLHNWYFLPHKSQYDTRFSGI